jgi:acetyl esterase/lipase
MGGSAGAHLAMLAAYTPAHPDLRTPDVGDLDVSVRGVVSCYGVSDLAAFHYRQIALLGPPSEPRFSLPCLDAWLRERRIISTGSHGIRAQEMVSGAMRGLPEEMPEQYALYSPLAHAGAHCPPTLLLLGENDAGVLAREQGAPLAGKLRAAGAPVVYAVVPGANHGFDLYLTKWNPAFQSALYDIERFLALLL